MKTFEYQARDRKTGGKISGVIDAESEGRVAERLHEMGYLPVSVKSKNTVALSMEIRIPGISDRVSADDLATFSRQFATMISAGLPLVRSLVILSTQVENKTLAAALVKIRQEIERGSSLSVALAMHPKIFDRLFVSMVRSGEVGGVLDRVLLDLATTLENAASIRRKIKSAMTYPVAVLILVVLILTAMLLFVVPQFKSIFASLHGTLPTPTLILLDISHIMVSYFLEVALVVALLIYLLRRYIRTEKGRIVKDKLVLKVPIFGKLLHKSAVVRFCRTLSSLVRSGVPLLEALDITKGTANNTRFESAISAMQNGVKQGVSLSTTMAQHDIFPPMVTQMVAVGEETGEVDTMLAKIGNFYAEQVEAMVASLSSLLEPVLIVVLGGVVGSMVISLYLPMFNVIKLIK
ncbi:type II secretion system F family protein [Acidithrix sp. C25]|uniref:type II secretion system F family protein n=1 Tax=Acidithrix sp. C25 TaxID=1671482 RepID=UPI00191BA32B|nr:type II secretion system F family protein [Acidithrix sp. C25]